MTHRISRIFIVALIAAATLSADEPKCNAAARECDHQIRQMLKGRRFLGVTVEERAPGLMIKAVVANSPAERAGGEAIVRNPWGTALRLVSPPPPPAEGPRGAAS